PEFWESRYREGITPWDHGAVPPDFLQWLGEQRRRLRVLVPGCGSAYEVASLADAGHDVLAIDYSPAAVERARGILGDYAGRVHEADFFAPLPGTGWQVIYERAFLCALPPRLWPSYAQRMAELLSTSGYLLGYFFVAPETGRGPPFAIEDEHLGELLDPWFERLVDRATAASLPVFRAAERWQVWRRRENG
ncbi:MAG: methyltransferase domain-containing protein, partial [Burkholderiales bacterium]